MKRPEASSCHNPHTTLLFLHFQLVLESLQFDNPACLPPSSLFNFELLHIPSQILSNRAFSSSQLLKPHQNSLIFPTRHFEPRKGADRIHFSLVATNNPCIMSSANIRLPQPRKIFLNFNRDCCQVSTSPTGQSGPEFPRNTSQHRPL